MGVANVRARSEAAWELQQRQHGVVAYSQLRALGFSAKAIEHRVRTGRLHRLTKGIYAVGRPEVGQLGRWLAAVLSCGPEALLSHRSAAGLWGIRRPPPGTFEVVVPPHVRRRRDGVRVYRLADPPVLDGALSPYRRRVAEIPVTSPVATLVDLSTCLPTGQLEAAVNEADQRDLVDPEALRAALEQLRRRPGTRRLIGLLDATSLELTTTELEHLFLPLADEVGLPRPRTQEQIGTNRVDFLWPDLGLVVETDSLRYHRTAFKQAADKRRDNANVRRGLVTLRFTYGQVRDEPAYVRAELKAVTGMLCGELGRNPPL